MMRSDRIPVEMLRRIVNYDPSTGLFFWSFKTADDCVGSENRSADDVASWWNSKYSGKPAFLSENGHGYLRAKINGTAILAHRAAWAMMTGEHPVHEIDHINRDKSDNRWKNLRQATRLENSRNRSPRSDALSGFLGVSWSRKNDRWRASICVNKRPRSLGYFDLEVDAARAYDASALLYFGEFASLNFPHTAKDSKDAL